MQNENRVTEKASATAEVAQECGHCGDTATTSIDGRPVCGDCVELYETVERKPELRFEVSYNWTRRGRKGKSSYTVDAVSAWEAQKKARAAFERDFGNEYKGEFQDCQLWQNQN